MTNCAAYLGGIVLACTLMQKTEATNAATPAAVAAGRQLFLMNCAHCHAQDATGDEGPDLHGLKKSDARIARIIGEGIQGEMPRFWSKLQESDVKLLIQYLRSLPAS
ncbi:MAG TPA: c-type cytochrome [Candidatus Limnocylindria bacterium]|nr:c-type cytochrome [Candidatus Limnocylindria bacterium]